MVDADKDRGMVPEKEWQQTQVHQSSSYWCGKCGEKFNSPHAVYDHMDKEHPSDD